MSATDRGATTVWVPTPLHRRLKEEKPDSMSFGAYIELLADAYEQQEN